MTVKYCQQWSLDKGSFALTVSGLTGIHPRVVLAHMAVESGNAPIAPSGAKYNFLQIKERGDLGQTRDGFAIYSSPLEAGRAAARRLKGEPGIKEVLGKGPEGVMRAIARTWNDGPGVTRGGIPTDYYGKLKAKFNCIDKKAVVDGGFRGVRDPGASGQIGGAGGNTFADVISIPGNIADTVGGKWNDLVDGLGYVLLKGALTATGLALMGYGLVKAFGVGDKTREAVTRVAPVAAAAKGAA